MTVTQTELNVSQDRPKETQQERSAPQTDDAPIGQPRLIMRIVGGRVTNLSNQQASTSDETADNVSSVEYPVSKILGMHSEEGTNTYKILWADGSTSWELEDGCRGCVDKINEFRREKGETDCSLERIFGADDTASEYNSANWVSIPRIIDAIDHLDRHPEELAVPVSEFEGTIANQTIKLIGLNSHIYVMYRSLFTSNIYIADGSGFYLKNVDVKREIQRLTGTPPIGVKFVGQSRVDHCASSAVVIALEFRRFARGQEEPTLLKAERRLLDRLKSSFHEAPSKPLEAETALRNLEFDKCHICGGKFSARNRRKFHGHMLGHSNKR